jgi:hypothetical protein
MAWYRMTAAAIGAAAALSVLASGAEAGSRKQVQTTDGVEHSQSTYYRGGPKVRGYVARRGGYSYTAEDAINTYGDARSLFGGASSLRDPSLDRQTNSGPFDHGFFFDSGIGARGGDSPYMN